MYWQYLKEDAMHKFLAIPYRAIWREYNVSHQTIWKGGGVIYLLITQIFGTC
jgi:hypothetical protein